MSKNKWSNTSVSKSIYHDKKHQSILSFPVLTLSTPLLLINKYERSATLNSKQFSPPSKKFNQKTINASINSQWPISSLNTAPINNASVSQKDLVRLYELIRNKKRSSVEKLVEEKRKKLASLNIICNRARPSVNHDQNVKTNEKPSIETCKKENYLVDRYKLSKYHLTET